MKRLKWEEGYDKNFLFATPEKGINYRIEKRKNKDYGIQYIAELWHEKYEDYERLSPWAWMDCDTLLKAKRCVNKHYKNVLEKRKKNN